MYWLLLFAPVSWFLQWGMHAAAPWVFGASLIAIVPMAEYIRKSTEELAKKLGPAMGGLLNISFGNAPELVLALFVLAAGETRVAQAQITGSIIGNSLLGLGLAAFVGGVKREHQAFSRQRAGHLSSLLILVLFALLIPAMFDYTQQRASPGLNPGPANERMSIWVSGVLLVLYFANLIYTFVTHRDMFRSSEHVHEEELAAAAAWPTWKSVCVLLGMTILVAMESELVSTGIESTASHLGISKFFLGITVLAIVGNAAEYFSAIYFARRNRMGLVMSITVGSSIQVALLVAPVLVFASFLLGHPMTLVFPSALELVAVAAAAFAVNTIAQDGETTWFEGVLLVGLYVVLAVAFFFVEPGAGSR